jgi:hypothetical protein
VKGPKRGTGCGIQKVGKLTWMIGSIPLTSRSLTALLLSTRLPKPWRRSANAPSSKAAWPPKDAIRYVSGSATGCSQASPPEERRRGGQCRLEANEREGGRMGAFLALHSAGGTGEMRGLKFALHAPPAPSLRSICITMACPSRCRLRHAMRARFEGGPACPSALTLSRYTPLDLETNLLGGKMPHAHVAEQGRRAKTAHSPSACAQSSRLRSLEFLHICDFEDL